MAHDQKGKQALERHGWNHAQINRCDRLGMVAQERPPGLRRRLCVPKTLSVLIGEGIT
jgi:hypothetical protein